jgi:phage baseplate assembly protein V
VRAKPLTIDDAGESQTASVRTHNGTTRSDVEILQPFGVSSMPPAGSLMVVLAVGGDQGDLVGLPVGAPGARMGGLAPGESVLYGAAGQRVLCKADGSVNVLSATAVKIKGQDVTIEADSLTGKATAITLDGPVTIKGNLTVEGSASIGGSLTVGGSITAGGPIIGG